LAFETEKAAAAIRKFTGNSKDSQKKIRSVKGRISFFLLT
jgi:hypothetical protein